MKPFLEQMQSFHAASRQTVAIYAALEEELRRVWAARDDGFAQLHLETATWSLPLWERAYGLNPEENRPAAYRRERVKARMRGQGTTTAALVKNVAQSFTDGGVELEEYPERYGIVIRFHNTEHPPENVKDADEVLNEILPAHITHAFVYAYRAYAQMNRHLKLSGVAITLAAANLGIETVRLDGMRRLDGTWALGSVYTRGLRVPAVRIAVNHTLESKGENLLARYGTGHRTRLQGRLSGAGCGACNRTKVQPLKTTGISFHMHARNRSTHTASLKKNSMWRLGNEESLDGHKRLNAEWIRSDF